MREAPCCRTTLALSKTSSASFEAFSWAEDRTKQGSKVSHQIPTRNDIAFPCTFFVHNRQAPLQFIIGRGCPYDIATPTVNAGLLENFSCHWTAFILHPLKMNSVMSMLYLYALVSHGLGFYIFLSHICDVKEKRMFALYLLLTVGKVRKQGWNSHLGWHERFLSRYYICQ